MLRSPLVAVSDEALLALQRMGDNLGGALMRSGRGDGRRSTPTISRKLCRFPRTPARMAPAARVRHASTGCCRTPSTIAATGRTAARAARPISTSFWRRRARAAGRMSLDEFVDELALLRESDLREPDAPPEDSADAVQVMTVHSAKGLEFPIVFVAALHKGVESDPPVVAFSPRIGLGARWRNPARRRRQGRSVPARHAARSATSARAAESNRLLYVAMTRAEQHLVLDLFRAAKSSRTGRSWWRSLQLPSGGAVRRGA